MSKLLTSYHDIDIYERDLCLFSPGEWLNDTCVSFCLKRCELTIGDRMRVLLMDAAVVSFMRFQVDDEEETEELAGNLGVASRVWILAPVNDCTHLGGSSSHWSLLAYHVQSGSSYHFDSSNQFNKMAATTTASKLSSLCGREMKAPQALPVAQQSNGYDCGVYTVMFAELFMQAVTGSAASDGQALDSPDSIRTAVFTDLTPAAVAAYRLKCIRDIQELCSSR